MERVNDWPKQEQMEMAEVTVGMANFARIRPLPNAIIAIFCWLISAAVFLHFCTVSALPDSNQNKHWKQSIYSGGKKKRNPCEMIMARDK